MTNEPARFLTANGEEITRIQDLDVVGSIGTPGSPFYAVVRPRDGREIRPGPVLIETRDGARYPAQIERAEHYGDPASKGQLVFGVIGVLET